MLESVLMIFNFFAKSLRRRVGHPQSNPYKYGDGKFCRKNWGFCCGIGWMAAGTGESGPCSGEGAETMGIMGRMGIMRVSTRRARIQSLLTDSMAPMSFPA